MFHRRAKNFNISDAYEPGASPLVDVTTWPANGGSITLNVRPDAEGRISIDAAGEWPDNPNATLIISLRPRSDSASYDPVGVVGLLRGSITSYKQFRSFVTGVRNKSSLVTQNVRPQPETGNFVTTIAASSKDLKADTLNFRPQFELRFVRAGDEKAFAPFSVKLEKLAIVSKYDPRDFLETYLQPREINAASGRKCRQAFRHYQKWVDAEGSKLSLSGSQQLINPFIIDARIGEQLEFPMFCSTANSLLWYGRTQSHGLNTFIKQNLIKRDDIALDCGAHAGLYTTFFAHVVGPKGKVFAFDPFPQNNIQIEVNSILNGLSNVSVEWAGVGDKQSEYYVSNRGQKIAGDSEDDMVKVKTVTLDSYVKCRPTFLKLDVEGYEVAALRGAQKLLRECTPLCYIEVHPPFLPLFGYTSLDLFKLIPFDLYDAFVYGPDIMPGQDHRLDPSLLMKELGRVILIPKNARSAS